MKLPWLLACYRMPVRQFVTSQRAGDLPVAGAVAHCTDHALSGIGLLVDSQPDISLFDMGIVIAELSELLGIQVNIMAEGAPPSRRDGVNCAMQCRCRRAVRPFVRR